MVRLVAAIPVVREALGERFVVIGGLAVLCQLSTPLRSTSDLDTATARRFGAVGSLQLLLDLEGAQPADSAGVVIPTAHGDVKVDVIEVDEAPIDRPPHDPNDALYELAHAWAFATAEPMLLTAAEVAGSEPIVSAEVPVSGPGPLVAMKLQSAENRGVNKEATDLLDIVSLVRDGTTGADALAALEHADQELARSAGTHVDLWFFERRAHTLRRLRAIPEGASITSEILADVGEVLRAALER